MPMRRGFKILVSVIIATSFRISQGAEGYSLRVTEAWPGQFQPDITKDWFELSNFGTASWVSGVDPDLFYEDNTFSAAKATLIEGLTGIEPGESVVVVIGNSFKADDFRVAWESVIDLTDVEIGYTLGNKFNENESDGIGIWIGGPNGLPDLQVVFPAGLSGASYDFDLNTVSFVGNASGAVQNGYAVASPGRTANGPASPGSPVVIVNTPATTHFLKLPASGGAGALSGVLSDPTDPAAAYGINFILSDADTDPSLLTVEVSSDNQDVVPDSHLILTGAGSSRHLKIIPAGVGYANIVATATDPQNNTGSYEISYAASASTSTPATTRFHTGEADASTAIALDSEYMFVANDKDETLVLYDRDNSGLPLASFTFDLGLESEADLKANFRSGNRIYWIGSHANNADGSQNPDHNTVFGTKVHDVGSSDSISLSMAPGGYSNLKADLIAWDNANGHGLGAGALGFEASAAAGIAPNAGGGFRIEAAALSGGAVYLGFGAPMENLVNRNMALVIPVTNFASVADSSSGPMLFGAPTFLALGGRSIRSMAANASGDILILAGPARDSGETFELFVWDDLSDAAPRHVFSTVNLFALEGQGLPAAIVEAPSSLEDVSAQILLDNGETDFYDDGNPAHTLIPNFRKFLSDQVGISSKAGVGSDLWSRYK